MDFAQRRLSRLRGVAANIGYMTPPAVQITVLSGLHADTRLSFDTADFTIGPAIDDDVVLLDETLLSGAVSISVSSSVIGPMITVQTQRNDVFTKNELLTDNIGYECIPCDLKIDDVELHIEPSAAPGFSPLRKLAICLSIFAFTGFVFAGLQIEKHSTVSEQLVLPISNETVITSDDQIELASEITQEIETAGLSELLTVSQTAERTVTVSGSLPIDRMGLWYQIRRKADALDGGGVLIAKVNVMPTLSNLPAVSAVKFGPSPKLILLDGRELGIGDHFSAQWIIEAIDFDGFTLSRRGETATLSF